jgi:hypothetical protein
VNGLRRFGRVLRGASVEAAINERCHGEHDGQLNEPYHELTECQQAPAYFPCEDAGVERIGDDSQIHPSLRRFVEQSSDELGDALCNLKQRPSKSDGERDRDECEVTEQAVERITHGGESMAPPQKALAP